jgi:hypothetical protein
MVLAPNDLFSWNNKYNKYNGYNITDTFTCIFLAVHTTYSVHAGILKLWRGRFPWPLVVFSSYHVFSHSRLGVPVPPSPKWRSHSQGPRTLPYRDPEQLWWCPFKIQTEKWPGLQFTRTICLSLVLTTGRIRWTIPLRILKYICIRRKKWEGAWSLREMGSTREGGMGGASPPSKEQEKQLSANRGGDNSFMEQQEGREGKSGVTKRTHRAQST